MQSRNAVSCLESDVRSRLLRSASKVPLFIRSCLLKNLSGISWFVKYVSNNSSADGRDNRQRRYGLCLRDRRLCWRFRSIVWRPNSNNTSCIFRLWSLYMQKRLNIFIMLTCMLVKRHNIPRRAAIVSRCSMFATKKAAVAWHTPGKYF